jgi:hypothetical protein
MTVRWPGNKGWGSWERLRIDLKDQHTDFDLSGDFLIRKTCYYWKMDRDFVSRATLQGQKAGKNVENRKPNDQEIKHD